MARFNTLVLSLNKMFSKTFLIFLLMNLVSDYSYGQRNKKFFRKDYTYIEASEGFYKIHTIPKTWADAKRVCALEGASLFYPENDNEAETVISFWNATQSPTYTHQRWVFVGISDLVAKGVFETIHVWERVGAMQFAYHQTVDRDALYQCTRPTISFPHGSHPISDVYHNWDAGEPNDSNGEQDCIILKRDGTLNDARCYTKNPFICKKSLLSLEWNQQCNIPNLDYDYNEEIGRCYKFHQNPLNWTDAYAVCSAEQSYLAVINTQLEADFLVRLTETKTKNKTSGNNLNETVHLGFHNRLNEGWQAVRGTPLKDTGYVTWDINQPDEDREQCGSMFYNGLLHDISCDTRSFFVCEHEVDTLGSQFDDRSSV